MTFNFFLLWITYLFYLVFVFHSISLKRISAFHLLGVFCLLSGYWTNAFTLTSISNLLKICSKYQLKFCINCQFPQTINKLKLVDNLWMWIYKLKSSYFYLKRKLNNENIIYCHFKRFKMFLCSINKLSFEFETSIYLITNPI